MSSAFNDVHVILARFIRDIAHGAKTAHGMPEHEAYELFAAMLDGGVPDLELGAALIALRLKTESLSERLGFYRAISERVYRLQAPGNGPKLLVFGSYHGAREEPNLLALLLLMLRRLGIPVLVHGTLEGGGRIATIYILRELGILPCANLAQAQDSLNQQLLAFVPTAVVCPGLANLLALRNRLGVRTCAHHMVKLLNPCAQESVRVVSASTTAHLDEAEEFFLETGFEALLLKSTEGESFANPMQRPRLVRIHSGRKFILFEEEARASSGNVSLPSGLDAVATAAWIRLALAGEVPIPRSIVNQLACCLLVSGYAGDMHQAKAIAAVEAGGRSASGQGVQGSALH